LAVAVDFVNDVHFSVGVDETGGVDGTALIKGASESGIDGSERTSDAGGGGGADAVLAGALV